MNFFKKLLNIFYKKNYFIDDNSTVGLNTYIGKGVNVTKSKIGNYCSIGPGVMIGLGEHDINQISTSSLFYENPYDYLTIKDCLINHDVWIGANAIILRGVEIGIGAVIGAGAIVTKDVPNFSVVTGVPARVIKYRFDIKKQKAIINSKWWEYDLKMANKIINNIK